MGARLRTRMDLGRLHGGNQVTKIDPRRNRVSGHITVGRRPDGFAVSRDQSTL